MCMRGSPLFGRLPVPVNTEKRRRAAAALIRRGVSIIPVSDSEKTPGRPGWESLRISEEEISNYWTIGQNIGLLCGEPSGDRMDVDLDPDKAVNTHSRKGSKAWSVFEACLGRNIGRAPTA
jgi:hypothetical protein